MPTFEQKQNQPIGRVSHSAARRSETSAIGRLLHPILGLQRGIGNQAVLRLLHNHCQHAGSKLPHTARLDHACESTQVSPEAPARIQTKLTANTPGYFIEKHPSFAEGKHAPKSSSNRQRPTHDLAHVVQHRSAGSTTTLDRETGSETDSTESDNWHTVKPGESLSLIAADVYGDLTKWPAIFDANRDQIQDENRIDVGWRLFIPPLDVATSLAEQAMKGMDKAIEKFDFAGQCELNPTDWDPIDHENFRLKPGRSASDAVKAIFAGGTAMDCACALWATLAYSVLNTVGPDRFDRAMGKAGENNQNLVLGKRVARAEEGMLQHLIDKPMPDSIDDLLPGDAVYFKNTEDIHVKHPESPWQGENTIYKGNGQFSGHGVGTQNADAILKILADKYNKPPTPAEKASPDYDWTFRYHQIDVNEVPGIQWHSVLRLHAESVESL